MTNALRKNYREYKKIKNKKRLLDRFFRVFLNEAIFRTTKIEHPDVSRKTITSALR